MALPFSAHVAGQTRIPTAQEESQLIEHGHYTNKLGVVVHSPAHSENGVVPLGATAQCRDTTYSFSRSHRGTCSGHGGVAQWID